MARSAFFLDFNIVEMAHSNFIDWNFMLSILNISVLEAAFYIESPQKYCNCYLIEQWVVALLHHPILIIFFAGIPCLVM